MGTITVKNLSSYNDSAALIRVGAFIAGRYDIAVNDTNGCQVIDIKYSNDVYTVTDK